MAPLWYSVMAPLQRSEDFLYLKRWHLKHCSGSPHTFFSQVDTIVFATGYNYDFPYLPKNIMYKSGHRLGLYKHVFPPNLKHPTLAIVGFIHAFGAIMPQAEMQARWVVRVFKGEAVQHLDSFRSHLCNYFSLPTHFFRIQSTALDPNYD